MSPLTCDLLLIVVVVTGGEQLSEDERGDVHLLVFVLHHGDPFPVVPDGDGVGLTGGGRVKIYIYIYVYEHILRYYLCRYDALRFVVTQNNDLSQRLISWSTDRRREH